MIPVMMQRKACKVCKEEKYFLDFSRMGGAGKVTAICKKCINQKTKRMRGPTSTSIHPWRGFSFKKPSLKTRGFYRVPR